MELKIRRAFDDRLPSLLGDSYERREAQVDMALAVGETLARSGIGVMEAGTGLGKSLAYLVPTVIHCSKGGSRAVITTHTKALQNQLVNKDLDLALRAVGTSVKGAVLMGRSNYACRLAVRAALEKGEFKRDAQAEILARILDDEDGIIDNVPSIDALGMLKGAITCPASDAACTGCSERRECFLFRARSRALAADMVFINHALLFSYLGSRASALGDYDVLIVDEAHHLSEAALNHLTLRFTDRSLQGSERSVFPSFMHEVIAYTRAMALAKHPEAAGEIESLWKSFADGLKSARDACDELLMRISKVAWALGEAEGGKDRDVPYGRSFVYYEGSKLLAAVEDEIGPVEEELYRLVSMLGRMAVLFEDENEDENQSARMLSTFRDAAAELAETFSFVTSASDEDYVFFAKSRSPSAAAELTAAPCDVSAQLGAYLEECPAAIIMTSATLSTDGDFSFTLESNGLVDVERVETRVFESPFDLERQMKVLLASNMPPPSGAAFHGAAARLVASLAATVRRSILVLCTSHRQLEGIASRLAEMGLDGDEVLVQKETSSKEALVGKFRSSRGRVLLGLASFWEGVDFPGELLEIVVIAKMPFLVPSDPIVEARAQRMRKIGEDPFAKLFLPDAVLKFKQGAGRLIRTGRDRGVVIILDSRLADRTYGRVFLDAVRGDVKCCGDIESLVSETLEAFAGGQTGGPEQ